MKQNISRNQVVVVLMLNLMLFSYSILVLIKWVGMSNIKFYASFAGSLGFLFFIVLILKTHYRLLFK